MIHDEFYWISQINKASVVSNSREKLLDEATAKLAARGIAAVEKEAEVDASKRVKKYIAYEPMVIAATGPEVTILHAGVQVRTFSRRCEWLFCASRRLSCARRSMR